MHLQELNLQNFKSYENLNIRFHPRLNCFIGDNGVGKTNLLDAIYYLSITKSYFNSNDFDLTKTGESYFTISGKYERDGEEQVHCAYSKEKKKIFKRNQKIYKRISEHIGLLPVVMISPFDSNLIIDSSEIRRRFMDVVIAQYDAAYIASLVRYQKALQNRNKLLKTFAKSQTYDQDTLLIYEDMMAAEGQSIYQKRQSFIETLAPLFNTYYKTISGDKEDANLTYKSQLHAHDMEELFRQAREKDRILQHSSVGVHRDDINMLLDEKPIKLFGSQGQQKTFLTALKFAKFDYIHQQTGIKPLLLLDDIFDKFDHLRMEQIIKIVSGTQFGQIFITDTNKNRLDAILQKISSEHQIFSVKDGKVTQV